METIFMYVITVAAAAFLGVNAQAEAKSHKTKEHKHESKQERKERKKEHREEKKARKHEKKHGKDKEIVPLEEEKTLIPEVKEEANAPVGERVPQ